MNSAELSDAIKLSTRAIIITGTLTAREKKSEGALISGFTPHYATQGVPVVPFNGDEPDPIMPNCGACIECAITEPVIIPSVSAAYGRPLNLVHMMFGNTAIGPTINEYKILREAGQILQTKTNQQVHLVSLPVLSAGQYGVAQGRQYILGVFNLDGTALFLNPAAIDAGILKAEYPANQKTRTLQPVLAQAPAPAPAPAPTVTGPNWYDSAAQAIGSFANLKGSKLHQAVLEARAKQHVKDKGLKPKEAAALAAKEYDELKTPAVPANVAPAPKSQAVTQAAPAQKSLLSARVPKV